jgi:hypothetical protein
MLFHKPKRNPPGRGLEIVTAGPGLKGGVSTKTLRYGAHKKFTESLKTRPNRLVPPPQPRCSGHGEEHEDQFHYEMRDNEYQDMNPYQVQHDDLQAAQEVFKRRKRRRTKASERAATAANWKIADQRMVAILTSTEPQAPCGCATEDINARFISLETYEIRTVQLCICGLRTAQFVKQGLGFFPSTPVKPRTFFSFRLLRVLYEQSVRGGAASKYAWAAGLRATHELYLSKTIPDFYELLLDAYHHFVAVENGVQARTSEYLQVRSGQENPWKQEDLSNCCPACFDFSHEPADRAAGITVDGNFQHLRLKDRGWSTYETFEPRKFVAYGVRDFATPEATVNDASCDNKFRATGG